MSAKKRLHGILLLIAPFFFSVGVAARPTDDHNIRAHIEEMMSLPAGDTSRELHDSITLLARYPFFETMDALVARLNFEVSGVVNRFKLLEGGNIKDWIEDLKPLPLIHILQKMKEHATPEYYTKVAATLAPLQNIARFSEPLENKLSEALNEFADRAEVNVTNAKIRKEPVLIHLGTVVAAIPPGTRGLPAPVRNNGRKTPQELMNEFREFMKARVTGQTAAIDALGNAVTQLAIFQKSQKPQKLILMGMPGTGQDTLVNAYAEFLNRQKVSGARAKEHVFQFEVLRKEADLWKMFGSGTGYVGSDVVPALVRFLVNHSGGRYRIVTEEKPGGSSSWHVIEESEPVASDADVRVFEPHQGIIYFNSFHNWSQDMKDAIKEMIETGTWTLNNPGKGVKSLHVPVQMIFATKEGSGLMTSKEVDGTRFGEPLPIEKMREKWQAAKDNRGLLIDELQRSNSLRDADGGQLGYSSEFLNKFHGDPIVLLEPLTPENLKEIVTRTLRELSMSYQNDSIVAGLALSWGEDLVDFIQSYHYQAEAMARPVVGYVDTLIRYTINEAIVASQFDHIKLPATAHLKVVQQPDKTFHLEFTIVDIKNKKIVKNFSQPILATAADKSKPVMPENRIKELMGLAAHLKSNVFGLPDALVQKLTTSILLAEEAKFGNRSVNTAPTRGATVLGLFGLSSTGKTETVKVINQFLYGTKRPVTIDFSQVQTADDIKAKILGTRDHRNQAIASDFMKHYDRNNGELLIAFDEIANAPAKALKALYDIFREAEVTTFSDGKVRPMDRVTIILTGNAGEEFYQNIPKDLPEWVQMYAMREIYKQTQNDPSAGRMILEKYFSPAMINRIGEQNINFFGPLTFKSLRELTALKLVQMAAQLKPYDGRRGWDLRFENQEGFLQIAEMVETHGFVLAEQGASIDRFVMKILEPMIRSQLLQSGVPSGNTVIVRRNAKLDRIAEVDGVKRHQVAIELVAEEGPAISLLLQGRTPAESMKERDEDRFLTAIHEAGHQVVRQVLLKDRFKATHISIVPGVSMIGAEWVFYAGVARSESDMQTQMTLEYVLAEMAILAAGETAQRLATKGQRHDAGKHNDMQRATSLAMRAILQWGLSPNWGTSSIPQNMTMSDYILTLSDERRKLLNEEVHRLVDRAQQIAKIALAANMDQAVIPLATALAEAGELRGAELNKVSQSLKYQYMQNGRFALSPEQTRKWIVGQKVNHRDIDAELADWIQMPKSIKRYEEIVAEDQKRERQNALLPEKIPTAGGMKLKRSLERALRTETSNDPCGQLLLPPPAA